MCSDWIRAEGAGELLPPRRTAGRALFDTSSTSGGHVAVRFPLRRFQAERFPFVGLLFTFAERQFDFDMPPFEDQTERNECNSLGRDQTPETIDFAPMQKKPPGTFGFMVELIAEGVRLNVKIA